MAHQRACGDVDALMLPGTPPAVLERYRTLAQRAEGTTFGLLEEDIVMLDTETTGLSFRKNELIEIAAARISGRVITDTFQTFVHPTGVIPQEIQALTGITNYDVADAPSAEDAVSALAEFVGGEPVVAHNASFDRTFIECVPGGSEVTDTWIDSLALSRIALPRLSSHRLADLAQAFGCASVTHRAMADVEALCGMWRILLLALCDLPAGLLGRLASMHEEVDWAYRPIFSQLSLGDFGASFSLRDVRGKLVADVEAPRRCDAAELGSLSSDAGRYVREAFAPKGLVSRMYDAYEVRPEQIAMAHEVEAALEESSHRALEAGTGVGKSMAYLVPAVHFAQDNGITVGVATKTVALTDQLVSHELPALDATLPHGVSFASLKGYDHYPCLRRVENLMVRELPVDRVPLEGISEHTVAQDMLTACAVTLAFACQSPNGDLDALGIRWRSVPRDLVSASHAECLRGRCPYYPHACFVHGARRRAACADVVVTNHSLLLRDVALDNAILPPIRHWIVDEAHSFEAEARRQWALELSAERVTAAFAALGGASSGTLHSLLARTAGLEASTLVAGLLTKAATKVQSASVATADLLARIHDLARLERPSGGYDNVVLWIDEGVRSCDEWLAVEEAGVKAAGSLDAAVKALREAQEVLSGHSAQMAQELGDATRALADVLAALKVIVLEPDDTYVYSAELYRAKKRMARERLVAEKLDVGADLAKNWYSQTMSVTFTSATMAVGESFEHFDHAVGLDVLDASSHKGVRLKSSYDYDRHMSVVVARDMPAPTDRSYLEALEGLLFDVHRAMEGSVLTLFTNRREMEQVYRQLKPRLAEAGLELACQERGTSPRRLSERFLAEESLSLFALKSFWEGFDAAGDTLRCVVIPKLPFASPRDPLVREREAREQRAWWRYSLPEAVLSVKQAAGRLIRTSTDTGVLVLADSRIASKRYGQTFLRALPTTSCQMLETKNVGRFIELWRASR